jgi:hypothetical protein
VRLVPRRIGPARCSQQGALFGSFQRELAVEVLSGSDDDAGIEFGADPGRLLVRFFARPRVPPADSLASRGHATQP